MERLYFGGTILGMEKEGERIEALLVRDGRIAAVGDLDEVKNSAGSTCEKVDLQGNTLCPGFIDGHSHVTMLAMALSMLNLTGSKSFDEIIDRIKAYVREKEPEDGQWIFAYGYDHNLLNEGRHPDKMVLEKAGIPNPVLMTHASGHMGVLNRRGLDEMKISADTKDPEDGFFGRMEGSREPNGYLEEGAFFHTTAMIPKTPADQVLKNMEQAQNLYFSNGITTMQEGYAKRSELEILKDFSASGKMKAEIIAYMDEKEYAELPAENPSYDGIYKENLKIGGYKIFLDGSPQGRTAWMCAPYAQAEDGYRGYPIYSDEEVLQFMERAYAEGRQILVHCNGDAAAKQMISCCKEAQKKNPQKQIRPVMIHAQLVRRDQLPQMRALGIIASFFVAHTYYWGDIHYKNFGAERANYISPVRSAIDAGVMINFHQDTPVIQPNMMETIWCAVNRKTREGRILGKEERCSVWEAMEAVTKWAAFAYFEEDRKGTLAKGKLADLVILDKNPLTCQDEELREIQVLQTIKKGEIVYTKERK